ncbi:hypothetical protein Rruber_05164 (plasmid) [Rhodococcus ruber]|uniref:VOC family protein n=1 Tax=Rhodococcus ruber TaxID=1830 RepID=UPI00315D2334
MALLTQEQLDGHQIVQIAFVVDNLEDAARGWSGTFGAGPFFVHENMPVSDVRGPDGRPAVFSQDVAIGQWGSLMVELVKWHDLQAGPVADVLGRSGFNHVAYFAPDSDAERERLEAAGHKVVVSLGFGDLRVHFHDAVAEHGFAIEHYPCADVVEELYRKVAEAAQGWDGADPVRGPIS